ncbi:hypothetical protein [Sphingobium cloacae]|uniref:hypothetical protein n=1 Tax=Sphingobium cloacae TaxID=120107 RepID=UPI00083384D5|nr:hypothetical protein [Sphingobium cloacae]
MVFHLILALQGTGSVDAPAIPPDFDLQHVKASEDSAIIVTGRRTSQRIERAPVSEEPPLGRAEVGLFGKARADVHVESHSLAGGAISNRVMVGIKMPF